MKTLEDALRAGRVLLKENEIAEGDIDAWYLLSYYLHMNRAQYLMQSSMPIDMEQYNEYLNLIKKRAEHIPLQYITREQEFMGLKFHVSEEVLIPRQDTEILVEEVLKLSKGKDILDLCTGSGCIIISLAKLGEIKEGIGVDISEGALSVAVGNAEELKANVSFILSDLYENVQHKFDIIVSNPPYIPTKDVAELMDEVKQHEPWLALDGKSDGLHFYRIIINGLRQHLKPGGSVFFEIGYDQGEAVSTLLKAAGITDIKVIKDLAGLDRVVSGRYIKAVEPFT